MVATKLFSFFVKHLISPFFYTLKFIFVTLQRIGLKVQRREVKKQLKQRAIKETMQLLSKFERTRANRRGVPFKTITSKLVFTKKEVRKRLGYQRLRTS
ncbi:hypothetical protein ACFC84_14320 [Enterococcus casseliflavus]|uniref:hypothetical protein n=1 Tax=Enterococcus TaxID=1350 RepID=UPI001C388CE3|nr:MULTISPECIES: hypothetical protein [Enterococcus]